MELVTTGIILGVWVTKMHRWKPPIYFVFVLIACLLICGCVTARRIGIATGKVALAAPFFLAEGLIDGLLDSDESNSERLRKKRIDEDAKRYWLANPHLNPQMTEAISQENSSER